MTTFQLAWLPIIVNHLINILSWCNIGTVKSTNIYAWPCSLIVIMANIWHVGPGIEGCGFEFWQRLSFLFCLGAGCKFLYFKDHWHDRMEIKESKVNAELSQVRDSYVWVTTVYSSLDHVCPTSCWWSMYNHIYLKCPSQHCVWWIPRFVLNQIYLFNILLLHGQNFWWQLCIYRSINTRRRFGEHERSVARGAKGLLLGGYHTVVLMDSNTNLENPDELVFFFLTQMTKCL